MDLSGEIRGPRVENFYSFPMGFEIFYGFCPCCVDNFDTCLFKAWQQIGVRLDGVP
jgi:hypothetical protein